MHLTADHMRKYTCRAPRLPPCHDEGPPASQPFNFSKARNRWEIWFYRKPKCAVSVKVSEYHKGTQRGIKFGGTVFTFASSPISAYVFPSYSKIGSYPAIRLSTSVNVHLFVLLFSLPRWRGNLPTHQTSPIPSARQSYPASGPETATLPPVAQHSTQMCRWR